MTTISRLSIALIFCSLPAYAAPKKDDSSLSRLFDRISRYLNSQPVRRARVTAVAAVRGGIPTDQGEDLDQRLMDRAILLRRRLLSADPAPSDVEALRKIYDALAVSHWVQALESDQSAKSRDLIMEWAKASRSPRPPARLLAHLKGGKPLNGESLVKNGWAKYCRTLTPSLAADKAAVPAEAEGRVVDPETARLDETLQTLKSALLGKDLAPADAAEARLLTGSVLAQLAQAPLKSEAPQVRALRGQPAEPSAPHRQAAPSVPGAPGESAASADDFNPKTLYAKASKAVVLIVCGAPDGNGELGSGSILDRSGRILTNAHVVIRGSTRQPWPVIRVYMKPAKMTGDQKKDMREPREAKVLAYDNALDLAVIQLERVPENVPTLLMADPELVSVGDRVATIGHPEQGGLWTLTTGVISTLVADLGGVKGKNAFQTDASINRGNSGGPLLNSLGEIIGVNTSMARKAADGLAITSVNYAIRSDVAKRWAEANTGSRFAFAPPEDSKPKAQPNIASRPVPKPEMITESKPFSVHKLIEEEIKEMDELEQEMRQEVIKRADDINK